jgi:DNA polymerase elongation subunit (family B)
MIREGEKIKYLYLRMPNPINEKVISFVTSLPEELSLDKHIDYEMQFEKSFVQPLTAIVEIIGWKLEETSSLEDLFV